MRNIEQIVWSQGDAVGAFLLGSCALILVWILWRSRE